MRCAEAKLDAASHNLSKNRQFYSEKLEKEIVEELKELNFADVKFGIAFSKMDHYTKQGFDMIEFQISTNPGEPVKALTKVVSGGELSRIMLAIKNNPCR